MRAHTHACIYSSIFERKQYRVSIVKHVRSAEQSKKQDQLYLFTLRLPFSLYNQLKGTWDLMALLFRCIVCTSINGTHYKMRLH